MDCRVIWTPAIFGCSLAEIFKWLKFGVWNETLQVCMRPIPKINFFGDRHDDTHCWGSRDCQFGFGFLAIHDWMGDSVFSASSLSSLRKEVSPLTTMTCMPRNRFRGFKAWSWMFTRSFALLGTKSMASLHSKHFPSLSSTCCVADVEKKISNFPFGWDGTSGFAHGTLPISCVLWSRGLSVCLSQTCIILHMLYRCNKKVNTKWTNENIGQIKDLQGQRRKKSFSFSLMACLCDPWAQRDSSRELSRNPTKVDQSPSWCQAQYLIFTGLNAIGLSMGSGDSAVMRPKFFKSS